MSINSNLSCKKKRSSSSRKYVEKIEELESRLREYESYLACKHADSGHLVVSSSWANNPESDRIYSSTRHKNDYESLEDRLHEMEVQQSINNDESILKQSEDKHKSSLDELTVRHQADLKQLEERLRNEALMDARMVAAPAIRNILGKTINIVFRIKLDSHSRCSFQLIGVSSLSKHNSKQSTQIWTWYTRLSRSSSPGGTHFGGAQILYRSVTLFLFNW